MTSALAFRAAWAVTTACRRGLIARRQDAAASCCPRGADAKRESSSCCFSSFPPCSCFHTKISGAGREGNRLYRAYFTADFIWHTALTAELTKYQMPPINPYLGDRTIQYYWTYFLFPAVIAEEGPRHSHDIESVVEGERTPARACCFLERLSWRHGRVVLGGRDRVRDCCGRPRRERRRHLRDMGSTFARPISRRAERPEHRRHQFMGVQRAPCRQSRAIDVVQPPTFDLGGALAPRDAGGGALRVSRRPSAPSPLRVWRWRLSTTFNPLVGGLFSLIYGAVILADSLRSRPGACRFCATRSPLCWWRRPSSGASRTTWSKAPQASFSTASAGYARNSPVSNDWLYRSGRCSCRPCLALWPPRQGCRAHALALRSRALILGLLVFYLVQAFGRGLLYRISGRSDPSGCAAGARSSCFRSAAYVAAAAANGRWPQVLLDRDRPADDGDRHLQRPGHQQPRDGTGIPLDDLADA